MDEQMLPDVGALAPDVRAETEDRLIRFAQFRHMGTPRAELCRVMGISGGTHDRWLRDPRVEKWIMDLQLKQETRAIMLKDRLQAEAQSLLEELLTLSRDQSVGANVRAQIKQDLLDREGTLPKRSHVESSGERKIFSDEQFSTLMTGLVESAVRRAEANGTDDPKRVPDDAG